MSRFAYITSGLRIALALPLTETPRLFKADLIDPLTIMSNYSDAMSGVYLHINPTPFIYHPLFLLTDVNHETELSTYIAKRYTSERNFPMIKSKQSIVPTNDDFQLRQ